MAEQFPDSFDDQPVLVQDQNLAKTTRNLIIGVLILIAAIGGIAFYWNQQQAVEENASAQLAKATSPEQLQQVADQYPGTTAGNSALLRIATHHQQKGEYLPAAELYARYAKQNPKSNLAPTVQFAQAQCLEAAGKKAEAQAAYLAIFNNKPVSPFDGGAAIALARLYKADNNISAARATLTEFLSRDLNSSYQNEANSLLRELSLTSGK